MTFELTCRELVEFLGEYLDHRLPEEARAAFDDHLAGCAACQAYTKGYEATIAFGRAAFACEDEGLPADVPADLVAAVLAARRIAR